MQTITVPEPEGQEKARENFDDSLLSNLPDHLLIDILSCLTLREAGRTCLLSRRWTYLASRIFRRFDFDAGEVMEDLRWLRKDRAAERLRYVAWVNGVTKTHLANELAELRICFDLDDQFSSEIDSWIAFAAAKLVKKLTLELAGRWGKIAFNPYRFPTAAKISSLRPNPFRSLTDLTLGFVVFPNDAAVQYFVDNCPSLERLCVRQSRGFHSLRANRPALRLKSLQILDCPEIDSVRISAEGLVTFEYSGPLIDVPFESVPRLSRAMLGGDGAFSLICHTHLLFADYSQLKTLKLGISLLVREEMAACFPIETPKLSNLEQLEITVEALDSESLLWVCLLVKAAPLLQSFSMKIDHHRPPTYVAPLISKDRQRGVATAAMFWHQHLKVLEFIGYNHCKSQVELCLCLIANAVSLEKVIIDVSDPFTTKERPWIPFESEKLEAAQRSSEELRCIRPEVHVVIL